MEKLIVLFQSTHDVIKGEQLCLRKAIACQAVPVPREVSSDCGIALEIGRKDKNRVKKILSENAISSRFAPSAGRA
jgi:hypothetical protein